MYFTEISIYKVREITYGVMLWEYRTDRSIWRNLKPLETFLGEKQM